MPVISLLGVSLVPTTLSQAVAAGLDLLEQPGSHLCCTPNPKLLTLAARDPALRWMLNRCDLLLADGVGVSLVARLTGQGSLPRCPGIDAALALAQAAGTRGKRIFLLGGRPGVAQAAGEALLAQCPGLVLAGVRDGYFTDPHLVAEEIGKTHPDLVFVCLGCPMQEQWMDRFGARTGARLLMGLGGTLDVWAGQVVRAPRSWQRLGLEWLWRGLRQPQRMLEWWRLPWFFWQALTWTREENCCEGKTDRP